MYSIAAGLMIVATLFLATDSILDEKVEAEPKNALDFKVKDIHGKEVYLAEKYKGKVVLIVNVASKCGFTPQYKGLQRLHEKYSKRGLAVLGFPCNQFGGQEPGTEEEILEFCKSRFDVEFDMFAKVNVNGEKAEPLFHHLTEAVEDKGAVKWNFEKFLIARDGETVKRFRTRVKPEEMIKDIETWLKVEEESESTE